MNDYQALPVGSDWVKNTTCALSIPPLPEDTLRDAHVLVWKKGRLDSAMAALALAQWVKQKSMSIQMADDYMVALAHHTTK